MRTINFDTSVLMHFFETNSMQEYIEHVGDFIDGVGEGAEQLIREKTEGMSPEEAESTAKELKNRSLDEAVYFQQILWRSVVLAIWAAFERKVVETWHPWADAQKRWKMEVKKKRTLHEIFDFWKCQGIPIPQAILDEIKPLQMLRNQIAHDDGRYNPHEEKRSEFVQKFVLDRVNSGKTGLSLSGEEVLVSREFCFELLQTTRELFHEIIGEIQDGERRNFEATMRDRDLQGGEAGA